MKKKLGMLLAVLLTFCMSVGVFADAGKTQQVDYKTDYYMIVESPDGGVDMYSEADAASPKLNDELIPNGTAIHVEGETKDEAGKIWVYAQLHNVFGFLEEDYLKPATLAEAVASELALYGSEDGNYDITVNAKEDGSVSLYKGPGKKYGTVSGGCKIANGEKLYIDTEVDTGKDGIWGHTEAGDVSGWVNIAEATNTEESTVELVPENGTRTEEDSSLVQEQDASEVGRSGEDADSAKPEVTAIATPIPEKTGTPTPEPAKAAEEEETNTPTPEPTESAAPTTEPTEAATATPEPTNTATPEPTATSTPIPEPTETMAPTEEPTNTAAPTDSAQQEASSENVESTARGMSSAIWILIVVIIIGIVLVIYLVKKKGKDNESK